ncbi:MAG: plastocyanin/azurin family copper-binding protein [Candidatus Nitrosocosmicus sp.]|nr:plastocyanin/azurin family copper-binding protein [Candidatus Nitrosocosmicus sp.]
MNISSVIFLVNFMTVVSIIFLSGGTLLTNASAQYSTTTNTNATAQNATTTNTNATAQNATTTTPSTEKVQVSIVPGASTLTDNAYSPNPVEISVGQTVVWTNDDSAFHTVTSGTVGSPDAGKLFDSGLSGPTALTTKGKTFEHTFDVAGEFPYHCTLHPAMAGTVIVK